VLDRDTLVSYQPVYQVTIHTSDVDGGYSIAPISMVRKRKSALFEDRPWIVGSNTIVNSARWRERSNSYREAISLCDREAISRGFWE